MTSGRRVFLHRLPWRERTFIADALRMETVGGGLLLLGALLGLVAANSPLQELYETVREFHFGPEVLHLHLSVRDWAADGLLAIFFFVVGLELKRELLVGELRNPAQAVSPVVAALGGMAAPAIIFVLINLGDAVALRGWAVPTATDIAFALAVLAVIGRNLPPALRAFLLTLAIVDDLGAITIIAIFYTSSLEWLPAVGAIAGLAVFWLLHHKGVRGWPIYVVLALVIWGLVHASGVHATIAGVAMGMCMRVKTRGDEDCSPAEHIEHRVRPFSAGIAVPIFAFTSAGVSFLDVGIGSVFVDTVSIGVIVGLVAGKVIGISGGSYLAVRLTRAELSPGIGWPDIIGLSFLAGIGFTVSLLINELAYRAHPDHLNHVRAAVLIASVIASLLAAVVLGIRSKRYKRIMAAETTDTDQDGIPDVYQQETHQRDE